MMCRKCRHGIGCNRDDGQNHQQQTQRRGNSSHRYLRTFLNQKITSQNLWYSSYKAAEINNS